LGKQASSISREPVFTENRVFWLVLETEFSVLTHVEKGSSFLEAHSSEGETLHVRVAEAWLGMLKKRPGPHECIDYGDLAIQIVACNHVLLRDLRTAHDQLFREELLKRCDEPGEFEALLSRIDDPGLWDEVDETNVEEALGIVLKEEYLACDTGEQGLVVSFMPAT